MEAEGVEQSWLAANGASIGSCLWAGGAIPQG